MALEFSFKPADGYILVNLIEGEKVTKGGIFIPETKTNAISIGDVIASGSDAYAFGDSLFYKTGHGVSISIEGEQYTIVHADNVYGSVSAKNRKRLSQLNEAA